MTLEKMFYVVESDPSWYELRLRETHYTISFGADLEKRLELITKYIRRYKTEEKIMKRVCSKTYEKGTVSKATFDLREEEYKNRGHLLQDFVTERVEKAILEVKENTPFKRGKKITKNLVKTSSPVLEKSEKEKTQEIVVKKIVPRKIMLI